MNVVLVHPIHGAKIATHQQELENDEKNGWTRYNPSTPVEKPIVVAPVEEVPVKRGRQTRKVIQSTIEQPNEVPSFLTSVSDESEGK